MKGLFITVEGIEGAGKSTQLDFMHRYLVEAGIKLLVTREPGGTPLAEEIRDILLQTRDEPMTPETELMLMFAARAQHLRQKITPALQAGKWVLCDRFTDATYAYQGGGRGLDTVQIACLEKLAQGDLVPDHVIYLDVPVETGLSRAKGRGGLDRFEQEDIAFFERVRKAYLERAGSFPDRYHVIDASPAADEVSERIAAELTLILDTCPR